MEKYVKETEEYVMAGPVFELKSGERIVPEQPAYIDNGVIRGEYTALYRADYKDKKGGEYEVVWEIINQDTEDESEACNWDKPYSVEKL